MITACAVCGEHVGRSRIEGFTAWENAEGQVVGREVAVVVHKECFMRLSPDVRDGLLEQANDGVQGTSGARHTLDEIGDA